ncbi:MAG: hypothetical protein GYB31_17425 [Bacteroidetes bacterium]|nr:hypothetical protein [Bacteroidota bacterium]
MRPPIKPFFFVFFVACPFLSSAQNEIRIEINNDLDYHIQWEDYGPLCRYQVMIRTPNGDRESVPTNEPYIIIDRHYEHCELVDFILLIYFNRELIDIQRFQIKFPCQAGTVLPELEEDVEIYEEIKKYIPADVIFKF